MSEQRTATPGPRGITGMSLVEILVVIGIIAALSALLLPTVKIVRDAAYAVRCGGHIRQLGLAMHGYASDNGELLPPVKWDRSGLGLTNWTSLISPYAEGDQDNNGNGDLGWGDVRSSSVFRGCPLYRPGPSDPQLGYGMSVFLLDGALAGWCNSPRADGSPFYGSSGVTSFRLPAITYASKRMLLGEVSGEFRIWENTTGSGTSMSFRHGGKKLATVLFCDFHVGSLDLARARKSFYAPQTLP
ncbi:MAG: DUF1559 domain-containing protein [Planctomycetes bacterium]|nr:DUF1559 domain-containing protein [Planctomycetota bacterium]